MRLAYSFSIITVLLTSQCMIALAKEAFGKYFAVLTNLEDDFPFKKNERTSVDWSIRRIPVSRYEKEIRGWIDWRESRSPVKMDIITEKQDGSKNWAKDGLGETISADVFCSHVIFPIVTKFVDVEATPYCGFPVKNYTVSNIDVNEMCHAITDTIYYGKYRLTIMLGHAKELFFGMRVELQLMSIEEAKKKGYNVVEVKAAVEIEDPSKMVGQDLGLPQVEGGVEVNAKVSTKNEQGSEESNESLLKDEEPVEEEPVEEEPVEEEPVEEEPVEEEPVEEEPAEEAPAEEEPVEEEPVEEAPAEEEPVEEEEETTTEEPTTTTTQKPKGKGKKGNNGKGKNNNKKGRK